MDAKREIREFLTSRRAKVTPDQAGLPTFGGTRRVPGLRREEVALLAGVSVDYYTRLERGNVGGVSETVLEALARALRLDEVERAHLFDLVGELSTRSETFGALWAAHNVHRHDTGTKRMHHPLVGEVTVTYEAMALAADPGLTMFVYTAERGSKSEEALNLLASWAATPDEEHTDADHAEQPRHERRS